MSDLGARAGTLVFRFQETVRFGQVDAAGIIFYPRYFEMINNTLEAWFADALSFPFPEMIGRHGCGVPVVDSKAEFLKPSRLGDTLTFCLAVVDLGTATLDLEVICECGGERRMAARLRHVFVQLQPLKSKAIPEPLRAAMLRYRKQDAAMAS